MIAVDTNLLVYAHRSGCPEHERAQAAIERACGNSAGWGIAWPSVAEFWMVVTHHSCKGGPSQPKMAAAFVTALVETGDPVIFTPKKSFGQRLIRKAAELGVADVRIFDLQIGILALDYGVTELWTHDAGFIDIPGLEVIDPLL